MGLARLGAHPPWPPRGGCRGNPLAFLMEAFVAANALAADLSITTFANGSVGGRRRDLRDAGFAGPAHGRDQRGERVVRARPPHQASHHGVAGGE